MALNVVWFKRDLRLSDHAPLSAAMASEGPLLLIYIIEPALLKDPHYRRRHWHFIAQSTAAESGSWRVSPETFSLPWIPTCA